MYIVVIETSDTIEGRNEMDKKFSSLSKAIKAAQNAAHRAAINNRGASVWGHVWKVVLGKVPQEIARYGFCYPKQ